MTNSLHRDSLRGDFATFLRHSGPLSAISPNQTLKPKNDILKAARQIADAPTETDALEVATLAFRCLYKEASGPEVFEIIRKHQHYIIQLTGSRNWKRAYVELTTLHGVFAGSRKYPRTLWLRLLCGVALNDEFPSALVLSFHFLVLQTVLQCISGTLASVCEGQGELTLSVFQKIADVFLSGSNLSNWLNKVNSDKYYNNCVRMLAGFVRVGEFVEKKKPEAIGASMAHLRMKLFEFSVRTGEKPAVPVLPKASPESAPFLQDLHDFLSEKQTEYTELLSNTRDLLNCEQKPVETPSPHVVIPSNTTDLVSLAKSTELHHNINTDIMRRLQELEHSEVTVSLADLYLTRVQASTSFEPLVPQFIPAFASFLAQHHQTRKLKQLEVLCLEHYKTTQHAPSLNRVVEIQLHYASRADTKLQNRIERCITALAGSDQSHSTAELAYRFVFSFPNTSKTARGILKRVAGCFLEQPRISGTLWFGKSLRFSDSQKVPLFRLLLEALQDKVPHGSSDIPELVSSLYLHRSSHLQSLYYAALMYHTEFSLADSNAKCALDFLYMAQIRILLLRSGNSLRLQLSDIHADILEWLKLKPAKDTEHYVVLLHILNELYELGYFRFTADLVQTIKTSNVDFDNLTRLRLDFCLAECYLRLSTYSNVSDVLQSAGAIMKSMHLEGQAVDCNFLIRWKMIQLEYFICMNDAHKSLSKLHDIETLIQRFPEYNLQSDSTALPLGRRLECLQLLAQFLLLASRMNGDSGSYIIALRNLKLAIKLLNTVMAKLEPHWETRGLKQRTENLLLTAYSLAFGLCRHLALLKDAIFYLEELEKLNDAIRNPIFNVFHNLELAIYFSSIGKTTTSLLHLGKGKTQGVQTGLSILKCLSLGADIICHGLENSQSPLKSGDLLRLCDVARDLDSTDVHEALSRAYLLDARLEIEFYVGISLDELLLNEETPLHQRRMLQKATTVVSSSLEEVNKVLKCENNEFDTIVKLLPHFSNQVLISEEILRKLLECKEIVHNCLEKERPKHLEVRRLKHINALFNRCVFLLSYFALLKTEGVKDLISTVYALLDLPKSLPYSNQQSVIESQGILVKEGSELLPILKNDDRVSASGEFNQELLRLLPTKWLVVSIDICSLSGDLILSKFTQDDQHPFFFKIPLKSPFPGVLLKLKQIVDDSNNSTKSSVTSKVTTKEERIEWWKLRFDLDLRLKGILDHVEQEIFGSFAGLFEHPDRSSKAYLKFRRSLTDIWRSFTERDSSSTLNDSIVDLFYCARPFDGNGVFDSRVIEELVKFTLDYTCSKDAVIQTGKLYDRLEILYYSVESASEEPEHLVLVPSSSCCSFPWESLSCLQNRSISRVPSVSMLVSLLEKASMNIAEQVKSEGIFYLVNLGHDLKRTQQKFQPMLESIENARGLCGEAPKEDYLISNLFNCGLYVFLGHGGGEQYMRTSSLLREKQKLGTNLPPAILMGCSSGAYHDNGELEPTSNVFKWLVCGSPMVVTNLWDITDKDIDNFSEAVFSKWGFLGQKGEGNISQAVASSRTSCTLRYLNGAAPVVHGLPLSFH